MKAKLQEGSMEYEHFNRIEHVVSPVLPVEREFSSGIPPDEYLVLTPLTDEFALFGITPLFRYL
jgi:hypothetical protein